MPHGAPATHKKSADQGLLKRAQYQGQVIYNNSSFYSLNLTVYPAHRVNIPSFLPMPLYLDANNFFAVFLYFLATMMMDQPIFSLPVLVFAAAGYFKFEKKHMFLTGFLLMVAAHKAAWMMLMPRGSTSMAAPAASFILERAGRYFLAMLPVPTAGMPREFKILTALFFVLIVVTGFFLHLRKGKKDPIFLPRPAFAHLSQPGFIFYIYGFLVTWVIGHIIVFATVSPRPFIVRYIYMAAFGLNALLVISLYPILKKVLRNKNKFIYLVFIIVILSAGISRFFQLHSYYSSVNRQQEKIVTKLKEIDPPQDAQVVVYLRGKAKNFWGVWKQSSGHLKHMMKRKDIDGLMGPGKVRYFNYYDAFNTKERGLNKKNRMRGLDLNRPLFLFAEKHDKLDQYEYALRWQRKEKDVLWTIFKLDKKNGGITALLSGQSRDEFRAAVKKLKQAGVARSEICWAGQPKYMDPKAWGGQPGKSGKETKSVPGNRL